ncbi:type II toxin-antitoxin system RelE/ParE family toxin [Enterococcus diestrammenae]|uniref:type II toxin-antitoxin system RelE/ParE family toxin n=1 Tax=Enterococcus TaxID=1350 RepID=UPI00137B688D|nr:type II toxin-antitoxin system RelE/ParE family toxin [Enterococcus diestrammenae]
MSELKEKPLKQQFLNVIFDDIATDPYSSEKKTGDLNGIWSKGFTYVGTHYRVAYEIHENQIIPIILCGSHENFYEQLKNSKK